MKINKFIAVALLSLSISLTAQEQPNTVLVDEFGRQQCDEFLARIDNFFMQLNATPSARGYFVIAGENKFLRQKLDIELMFESAIIGRSWNRNRVTLIRGGETGKFQVKLWLVNDGMVTSPFKTTPWNLRMDRDDEPFMLRSDMEQICSPPPFLSMAKDLLAANPDGFVYVLVHGHSRKERQRELSLSKRELAGVAPVRIRYLLRYSSGYKYSDYYFAIGKRKRLEFKSYF